MVLTTPGSDQAGRRMTAPKPFNPVVRAVLRSPLHGILSRRLMLIEVRGRRTGRMHTFPVGYVRDGDTLHVLVGDYRTKTWWRNFEGGAPARLTLRGRSVRAVGEVLRWESDPQALTAALARYASTSGFVRRSLRITGSAHTPDLEALRAAAREVVMVRIRLEPGAGESPAR